MRRSLTGRSWLVAGLVLSLVVWLGGCDAGGEDRIGGPDLAVDRSGLPPRPQRARAGSDGHDADASRAGAPDRPPTSDAPPTSDRAADIQAETAAPWSSVRATAASPTSAEGRRRPTAAGRRPSPSPGPGRRTVVWVLLALLVVGGLAGWLMPEVEKGIDAAWRGPGRGPGGDTRTVTGTQLPPVLTAEDVAQRALIVATVAGRPERPRAPLGPCWPGRARRPSISGTEAGQAPPA